MGESTTLPVWAAILAGIIVAVVIPAAVRLLAGRLPEKKTSAPKPLTLRIDEVPISTSRDQLERELESTIRRNSDLTQGKNIIVHHLTPRDHKTACATATFHSSLAAPQLLQRIDGGHSYRFDDKFHGITPLYEAPGGGDVE